MGKSYLEPEELVLGYRWWKNIFMPAAKDTLNNKYISYRTYSTSAVSRACKHLYSFITNGLWDTNNDLEQDLKTLSEAYFKVDPDGSDSGRADDTNLYKLSKNFICRLIANICAKNEIFWDDTQHSPEELRYFIATPMGKALWDFRCFVSQEPEQVKIPKATSTGVTSRTSSGSSGATSSGSKLNLQNAGGLVSTQKEILNTPDMYWIDGTFTNPGKTKPRLHVSPFNQSSPLTVKYGSGQGFDDCVLFFDDFKKAMEFMAKADAAKPSSVSSLSLKRRKTDTNGYFKVNTQFGEAYIAAAKLHEMLEELEKENTASKEAVLEEIKEAYKALDDFMK